MELLRNNATVAMLMTMKELYNDFIRKTYDYKDGNVKLQVKDIRLVAKEWGYSESEVDSFLAYFNVKGYIEPGGGATRTTLYGSLLMV